MRKDTKIYKPLSISEIPVVCLLKQSSGILHDSRQNKTHPIFTTTQCSNRNQKKLCCVYASGDARKKQAMYPKLNRLYPLFSLQLSMGIRRCIDISLTIIGANKIKVYYYLHRFQTFEKEHFKYFLNKKYSICVQVRYPGNTFENVLFC